jgi:hypothetical protein
MLSMFIIPTDQVKKEDKIRKYSAADFAFVQ